MDFVNFYCGIRFKNNGGSADLENNVLRVSEPWNLFNSRIERFLCHLHLSTRINSRIPMPFKGYWAQKILNRCYKRFNESEEMICLIVNAHFLTFANAILKIKKRKKIERLFIVIELPDKYDYFIKNYRTFPSFISLKEEFDLVITYNFNDVKKYSFVQSRPFFGDFSKIEEDSSIQESDVFFVGFDKGRINTIHDIYDKLMSFGINCDFYVSGVDDDKMTRSGIHYNTLISYDEVLRHVLRTKCVLNLSQKDGEGYTLRDYEALGNNKLLLTNNYFFRDTELYDSNQVIFIDEIDTKYNLIKLGYHGKKDYLKEFGSSRWYEWLESTLFESLYGKH